MIVRYFLFLVFWFGCFSIVFSQNSSPSLKSIWNNMLVLEDYEKDFRFPAFIDSLKLVSESLNTNNSVFPSDWSVGTSPDSSLMVSSGILPFKNQPSRLVWIISKSDSVSINYVFHRALDDIGTLFSEPQISIASKSYKSFNYNSLIIKVGDKKLVDFPDIEIKLLFDGIVNTRSDEEKDLLSEKIWIRLNWLLENGDYFSNSFSGYDRLSTLKSPDGNIKICTWNIEYNNGVNKFYGGMAVNANNGLNVFRFTDQYQIIRSPEQATLSASRWYGAVYYELIENRYRGDTFYTLLGYNGNNPFSKIRVIEILTVAANGTPRFGSPLFTEEQRTRRRLIFEYSMRANMMLQFDSNRRLIVMDNLAPTESIFENDFRYYGPDFTHNALRFERGKWVFYSDIELRNPPPPRRGN